MESLDTVESGSSITGSDDFERKFAAGDMVWVQDADGYTKAEVIAIDSAKQLAEVDILCESHTVSLAGLCKAETEGKLDGVVDNTMLTHLNEANLLDNIRSRFDRDIIYTYTGSILLAVNPYKTLPLYGDSVIEQYRGKPRGANPPHVYAMADRVHRALTSEKLSQSVIVSGESGAGKTETCKAIMTFFLAVRGKAKDKDGTTTTLDQRIIGVNPILEAFGNAKTLRNNNSSRFGKFTKVHFDEAGHVAGASVVVYLLEKSRVVAASKGERNYHCFYQLCAGTSDEERIEYTLRPVDEYTTLVKSGCTTIEGTDDAANFTQLKAAMASIGIESGTQNTIFKTLSALLWLNELQYTGQGGDDEIAEPTNMPVAEQAAKLLGVDAATLQKALCSRSVVGGRGSIYYRPRNPTEAKSSTDAVIKSLYERLFHWLVKQINSSINDDNVAAESSSHISVLDIYGFESFQINTLEQLCINFANEKLQQFFVKIVMAHEQEAYKVDGIPFKAVEFQDNQKTVDLIQHPSCGIFGILDEVCRLPQPTDVDFTDKLHKAQADNVLIDAPRVSRKCTLGKSEGFIVCHFAGKVLYSSDGFVSKNMDLLHDDIERVIGLSSSEIISSLANVPQQSTKGKGRKAKMSATVVSRFSSQLDQLMKELQNTSTNYVRCIKPTPSQQPGIFDCRYVLDQLRTSGTNEALELMHKGFPTRCPFEALVERYRAKLPTSLRTLDSRSLCAALLSAIGVKKCEYAIGVTNVWFKAGKLALMDEVFRAPLDEIVTKVRKWIAKNRFRRAGVQVKGVLKVVAFCSALRAVNNLAKAVQLLVHLKKSLRPVVSRLRHRTESVTTIQAAARTHLQKKIFVQKRAAIIQMQTVARMINCKLQYDRVLQRRLAATIVIQCAHRSRTARLHHHHLMSERTAYGLKLGAAATKIQAIFRMHKVVVDTQNLKREADLAEATVELAVTDSTAAAQAATVVQAAAEKATVDASTDDCSTETDSVPTAASEEESSSTGIGEDILKASAHHINEQEIERLQAVAAAEAAIAAELEHQKALAIELEAAETAAAEAAAAEAAAEAAAAEAARVQEAAAALRAQAEAELIAELEAEVAVPDFEDAFESGAAICGKSTVDSSQVTLTPNGEQLSDDTNASIPPPHGRDNAHVKFDVCSPLPGTSTIANSKFSQQRITGRLSVGGACLLDKLTDEDDKQIDEFLSLNYEMLGTTQPTQPTVSETSACGPASRLPASEPRVQQLPSPILEEDEPIEEESPVENGTPRTAAGGVNVLTPRDVNKSVAARSTKVQGSAVTDSVDSLKSTDCRNKRNSGGVSNLPVREKMTSRRESMLPLPRQPATSKLPRPSAVARTESSGSTVGERVQLPVRPST